EQTASNEAFTISYNLESGTVFGADSDSESIAVEEIPKFSHSTTKNNSQWLFDTGSTVHICNDKTLFSNLRSSTTLGTVGTGGGPVKPLGIGTVEIEFLAGYRDNKAVYSSISLKDTLYIPNFP